MLLSHLVVHPRSDLDLIVVVTFAVVGNGEVGIVGHHLGVDHARRARAFVEHDVRPTDASPSGDGWFDHTTPAPPFSVSGDQLHDLIVSPLGIGGTPGGCVQVTPVSHRRHKRWGRRDAP